MDNGVKTPKVYVFEKHPDMVMFFVGIWRGLSLKSIACRDRFVVALSGGRTPVEFYQGIALQTDLLWEKTHIFLVDERFVPSDHQDSNQNMIKQTLLDNIPLPSENFHPISPDLPSPRSSSRHYEEHLKEFFQLSEGVCPCFDLMVLGLGEDGHTASLFPGNGALYERNLLAAPVALRDPRYDRITLTLPVINSAEMVFFLVTGENKSAVVKSVIERKDPSLPAAMVEPDSGMLIFLLDREAASNLEEPAMRQADSPLGDGSCV
jgi:6-phosphogluconolactonase